MADTTFFCTICRWEAAIGGEAHATLIHPGVPTEVVRQMDTFFIFPRAALAALPASPEMADHPLARGCCALAGERHPGRAALPASPVHGTLDEDEVRLLDPAFRARLLTRLDGPLGENAPAMRLFLIDAMKVLAALPASPEDGLDVERIASFLHDEYGCRITCRGGRLADDRHPSHNEAYRDQAKRLVAALKEPTP